VARGQQGGRVITGRPNLSTQVRNAWYFGIPTKASGTSFHTPVEEWTNKLLIIRTPSVHSSGWYQVLAQPMIPTGHPTVFVKVIKRPLNGHFNNLRAHFLIATHN
jgi:hypothetical protein